VELALSIHHRLGSVLDSNGIPRSHYKVAIVSRSGSLLSQHNSNVREKFERILLERGVDVVRGKEPSCVDGKTMTFFDGTSKEYNTAMFCTSARGPQFFDTSTPFPLTSSSFLEIDDTFQVTGHPGVFASGDCATNSSDPRPKAGVFAVRAGPHVRENVLLYASSLPLKSFQLQTEFLGLISTGDRNCIASRGEQALEGEVLWKLKDAIDVTWMDGFKTLPAMKVDEASLPNEDTAGKYGVGREALLENLMRCGGCGAKVGSGVLERVLAGLSSGEETNKSLRDMDDCTIVPLSPHPITNQHPTHLLQTIDYTPSFFSDPYVASERGKAKKKKKMRDSNRPSSPPCQVTPSLFVS